MSKLRSDFLSCGHLHLRFQVKVWFQNRRMKWRHSKEAQAQKDKDKEQPDTCASESGHREAKEPLESECESDGRSECESDEATQEDNSDGQVDVSDLNKTSVIMTGSAPGASSAQTAGTVTDAAASPVLVWRKRWDSRTRATTSEDRDRRSCCDFNAHPEWRHEGPVWFPGGGGEVEPQRW